MTSQSSLSGWRASVVNRRGRDGRVGPAISCDAGSTVAAASRSSRPSARSRVTSTRKRARPPAASSSPRPEDGRHHGRSRSSSGSAPRVALYVEEGSRAQVPVALAVARAEAGGRPGSAPCAIDGRHRPRASRRGWKRRLFEARPQTLGTRNSARARRIPARPSARFARGRERFVIQWSSGAPFKLGGRSGWRWFVRGGVGQCTGRPVWADRLRRVPAMPATIRPGKRPAGMNQPAGSASR